MKKKKIYYSREARSRVRKRMGLVFFVFVALFGVLLYRCLYLHVVADPRLERIAKNQYRTVLPRVSPRGTIYDAKGEELAVSVPTVSLAVRPQKISEPKNLARIFSKTLSLSYRKVLKQLTSKKNYVWIKRHLTRKESEILRQEDDPGLEWVAESKRFYPNRELASQIIGVSGMDGEGLGGLEYAYDSVLRSHEAPDVTYHDARGERFEISDFWKEKGDKAHDLWLTLNKSIQFEVESELEEVCTKHKAKSCTGIVMDPQSGAILAMASYPSFNPNEFQKYDWSLWKNRAITDGFEPGSIFKVVLAAAALESGAVAPEEKFFCENGEYKVGNRVIHDSSPHGLLSFREILKVSSNIGTFKVGKRVGKEKFAETIQRLGFGRKTKIDFPGESAGAVRPVSSWKEIDFANLTFGQGIRVTPIQMLRAFSVIASGGKEVHPHFVSKVVKAGGEEVWQPERMNKRILKSSTAQALSQILIGVTEEGGGGVLAQIPGYQVAGKTGTSQKFKNGQYSHTDFVSSFIGFVPVRDPRVAVLVTIDEPRGEYYGGKIAAPVFRRIAWSALRELGVPPNDFDSLSPKMVQAALTSFGLESVQGETKEYGKEGIAPRFKGKSMREVLALLDEHKITAELIGSGVAVSQDCSPGATLQKGQVCHITFQNLPY